MLLIKIDKRLRMPYYKQMVNSIETAIGDGVIKDGAILPKNKEVAQYFGISEIVARQAYEILEQKGLVARIQGKGTYVKYRPVITLPLKSLYDTASMFTKLGYAYDRALKMIDEDGDAIVMRTVDAADGYPIAHQTWWIYHNPEPLLEAIQDQDGTFEVYQKVMDRPITRLVNKLIPRSADAVDAMVLGIQEKTPVYFIRSWIYDVDDVCLLKAESIFTAEYLKFEVEE